MWENHHRDKIDKKKKIFYPTVDFNHLEIPQLQFWIFSYPLGFQNHRIQHKNSKMLSEPGPINRNIKLKHWVSFLVATFSGNKLYKGEKIGWDLFWPKDTSLRSSVTPPTAILKSCGVFSLLSGVVEQHRIPWTLFCKCWRNQKKFTYSQNK